MVPGDGQVRPRVFRRINFAKVLINMNTAGTKTRHPLPVWARTLLIAEAAVLATLGVLALLLGRDGLSLVQGWLLARWAFVEEDADLGRAADTALYGLVDGMGDRWSYYIAPENYQALQDRRANRYVGIGVTVDYSDERGLLIREVTAGSPAEQGGITAGELITAVDGQSVAGDARYEGVALIGGGEGTEQTLTVLGENGQEREVVLTLRYIAIPVVTGELLDNGMGLVTIRNFNTNADKEFRETVNDLTARGASALIFDLRNDGGGYIDELTRMLDFLLPEGTVFQSNPRWGLSSISRSDEDHIDLPFGALVNRDTYSAAELFAAQLRETLNTPIVGEVTSGKGYSQNTFPLANGGAMGVSTARYCTGSDISLIGTGITPDITLSLSEEQEAQLAAGTLAPAEDTQLQTLIGLME